MEREKFQLRGVMSDYTATIIALAALAVSGLSIWYTYQAGKLFSEDDHD